MAPARGGRGRRPVLLGLAACCAAPALGLRTDRRQQGPRDQEDLVFAVEGRPLRSLELARETRRAPEGRAIFAPRWFAGFDSSFAQIFGYMAIARAANARLVLPKPEDVFAFGHGDRKHVAAWWDDYLEAEPPVFQEGQVEPCTEQTWGADRLGRELRQGGAGAFYNHSAPLCVRLDVVWYDLKREVSEVADLYSTAAQSGRLALNPSQKVQNSFAEVLEELGGDFSAVHVRRGDMGHPQCTEQASVATKMKDMGAAEPWLLASNAADAWFGAMKREALRQNLTVTVETDVRSLTKISDNYFRYCLLKCAFGYANRFLGTYKHTPFECVPARRKMAQQVAFLCER